MPSTNNLPVRVRVSRDAPRPAPRNRRIEQIGCGEVLSAAMTVAARRGAGALHGRRVAVGILAAAVFLASWVMLDHWFFSHGRIVDTPYYQSYGLSMRNGEVPYRDFAVDYPPGALPVFVAPTYVGTPTWIVDYQRWFARLMAVCGMRVLAFVLLARPPVHGVVLVAVSPLLAGALILTPLRPLAGGVRRGRGRGVRRRPAPARLARARAARSRRSSTRSCSCRSRSSGRCGGGDGGSSRGARSSRARGRRRRLPALRDRRAARALGEPLGPGLAAAPDREPRRRRS